MSNIDYNKKYLEIISNLQHKPKLLLHSCCAPCSSAVLEQVVKHFDVTLFYYNPNITDEEEYHKRFEELQRFVREAHNASIPVIDGGYEPEAFFKIAKGLEEVPEGGKRCTLCYHQRLAATAKLAKSKGFDYFSTTLSISPYKDAQRLNRIGGALAKQHNVNYLYSDFSNCFERSIELSKKYNLYLQDYCGCIYSIAYGVPQGGSK